MLYNTGVLREEFGATSEKFLNDLGTREINAFDSLKIGEPNVGLICSKEPNMCWWVRMHSTHRKVFSNKELMSTSLADRITEAGGSDGSEWSKKTI